MGAPDGDDGRLRRHRPGEHDRPAHRGGRDARGDRVPHGRHRGDHVDRSSSARGARAWLLGRRAARASCSRRCGRSTSGCSRIEQRLGEPLDRVVDSPGASTRSSTLGGARRGARPRSGRAARRGTPAATARRQVPRRVRAPVDRHDDARARAAWRPCRGALAGQIEVPGAERRAPAPDRQQRDSRTGPRSAISGKTSVSPGEVDAPRAFEQVADGSPEPGVPRRIRDAGVVGVGRRAPSPGGPRPPTMLQPAPSSRREGHHAHRTARYDIRAGAAARAARRSPCNVQTSDGSGHRVQLPRPGDADRRRAGARRAGRSGRIGERHDASIATARNRPGDRHGAVHRDRHRRSRCTIQGPGTRSSTNINRERPRSPRGRASPQLAHQPRVRRECGLPPVLAHPAQRGFPRANLGFACAENAPGKIRTCDLCLRRAALYPLSYGRGDRLSVAARPAAAPGVTATGARSAQPGDSGSRDVVTRQLREQRVEEATGERLAVLGRDRRQRERSVVARQADVQTRVAR